MNAFDRLSELDPPDLWPEIERRAAVGADLPLAVAPRRRPHLVAAAAVAVVVALVGAALAWAGVGDDDADQVHTAPTDPGPPALACLAGGLAPGAIPDEASTAPPAGAVESVEGTEHRSWTEEGMAVEFQSPGPQYYDFIGERTEEVADPEGLLLLHDDEVRFLGGEPCGYEVRVHGPEAEARALALRIVRRFDWRAEYGAAECAMLSPSAMNVVEGATAAAAIVPLTVADVELALAPSHGRLGTVTRLADGRCAIDAGITGGPRVTVVVSGSDGTFGIDDIHGFASGDKSIPVELDSILSIQVLGSAFNVYFDYWCDACVRARVTLHYPTDGITGTAEITESGTQFEGELPAAPTPGSYGIVVITWEGPQDPGSVFDDLWGITTAVIPSGDFAAS